MNMRRHDHMKGVIVGALVIAATPGIVKADVLYDTTSMTDDLTVTHASQAYIGGFSNPGHQGTFWDVQLADDFSVGGSYQITSVTGDFITTASGGFQMPSDGVLVEFFAPAGNAPSEIASFAVLSQNVTMASLGDVGIGTEGGRLAVDLSGEGITLGPGTWWVSITPVDLTESGVHYGWLRKSDLLIGDNARARNGGEAHGNGYAGGNPSFDWGPIPPPFIPSGTLAMAVEGTLIPSPAVWAVLAVAGVLRGRRKR